MTIESYFKNISQFCKARLITCLSDSKKEERATSILLTAFQLVPEFAKQVLSGCGANINSRTTMDCYTEVGFKDFPKLRPDGLIIVTNGKKTWTAIVESKAATASLHTEQIENYLDLARAQGINALITLSNQYAPVIDHHPVKVNKQKLRSTNLYHFSWLSIISDANMLIEGMGISDREQAHILAEVVNYLQSSNSGILAQVKMSSDWRQACETVHNNQSLKKSDAFLESAVSDWHQLQRYLALKLSLKIGTKPATVYLKRKHLNDAQKRLHDDINSVVSGHVLEGSLHIPDTASLLYMSVDLSRKTLTLSVKLDAPKDVKRQTASINWIHRQLKKGPVSGCMLVVNWPRRTTSTTLPVEQIEERIDELLMPSLKEIPSSFDVVRVIDLGAKLKAAFSFVEISEEAVSNFYQDVCENLYKWVPKPPKIKREEKAQLEEN